MKQKQLERFRAKYVRCAWHIPDSHDVLIVERKTGTMCYGRKAQLLHSLLPQSLGICEPCAERVRNEYGKRRKPLYERIMKIVKDKVGGKVD